MTIATYQVVTRKSKGEYRALELFDSRDWGLIMSEANVNEVKNERGARKTRIGIVVSDKMDKTIVVELEDRKQHALLLYFVHVCLTHD